MIPIVASLVPKKDISGAGARWIATSDDAWFELRSDRPIAGHCVRLDWSAGLFDPVCRLVVRLVRPDRTDDLVLAAASFGRNSWTGRIPADTICILLSPTHVACDFGFRIDRLVRLSFIEMMARAFRRRPINAFLSLTARLRGWHQASESELREVFLTTDLTDYDQWRRERLRPVETDIDGSETEHAESGSAVHFILPLPDWDRDAVTRALNDLSQQDGTHWHLHVSVPSQALDAAKTAYSGDRRVIVLVSDTPLADYLSALEPGSLVHWLQPDAQLAPTFCRSIVTVARRHPDAVLIYGDEDRRDAVGKRCAPAFKGDFDPTLIREVDFIGFAGAWRATALAARLDPSLRLGARPDALLSVADTLDIGEVRHIARVLVTLPDIEPTVRRRREMPLSTATVRTDEAPFISVIIPTRDGLALLKPCIDSLFRFSSRPFELIIVDNGSTEPAALDYFDALRQRGNVAVLRVDQPFNFSDLCNRGAALATSKHLLFLNNDTEFLAAGWEDVIAPHLADDAIGAIGAKLLYGDGRVQHAGVILGLHGRCGHFEIGIADSDAGYFHRANRQHRLLAVTGAALAVRRAVFEAVDGFDATHLPVDLNDIDFCLRLVERGYVNLMVPAWKLAHHESATRGQVNESDRIYGAERRYFAGRWLGAIRNDPAFNPNLSLWRTAAALG